MSVKLIKEITHPFGTCPIGTEGIKEQKEYYVFPYEGKSRDDYNGWLGNGFWIHESQIEVLTEWVEIVE